jgi:hypothetical protein
MEYSREKIMAHYTKPPFGFIVLSHEQADDTELISAIKEAWPQIEIVITQRVLS